MRKKKISLISIASLLLVVILYSCQTQDDLIEDNHNLIPFDFKSYSTNGKELAEKYPLAFERVNHLNNLSLQKNSDYTSIKLDTTNIKVIQNIDAISYIFRVEDTTLTNTAKNYVLVRLRDSIWHQYMVDYQLDTNYQVDTQNTTIEPVFGDDLFNQVSFKCGGSSFQSVWIDGYTINHRCTKGGNHTVEDGAYSPSNPAGCHFFGQQGGATVTLVFGYWDTQPVKQEPCQSIDSGVSSGAGGGAGSPVDNGNQNDNDQDASNDTEEPNDSIGIGIVPNLPSIEIELPNKRKLKRISDQPNIKAKIKELRTKCVDQNQITEDGAQYIKNGSSYTERLPSFKGATRTRFDPDFVPGVEVVVHMHERQAYRHTANGLVRVNIAPVFSVGDIYAFMGLAEYCNFDNNNVTAILVSPAGAFAMRVDDMDALEDALALLEPVGFDGDGNPIDSPDMEKLKEQYDRNVIEKCGDTDDACFRNAFSDFITNFTLLNGNSLGISYYEGTLDSNDEITEWIEQ